MLDEYFGVKLSSFAMRCAKTSTRAEAMRIEQKEPV